MGTYKVVHKSYTQPHMGTSHQEVVREKEIECDGVESEDGVVIFYENNKGMQPVLILSSDRLIEATRQ
jgi:hypothetical protein